MLPGGPKYRGGGGHASFGKVPKLICFFYGVTNGLVLKATIKPNIGSLCQILFWLLSYLTYQERILARALNFFPRHGWRKKHLKKANICNDEECRLCCEENSIESPIHIFSECVAMADTRQGLFNDPYPTQLVGRMSLCQVSELVFVDTICDLIDIDQNYSNISLKE